MGTAYSVKPSLFISHGSPMLALENRPTSNFLRHLGRDIGKPSAIIVASAHWETRDIMLTATKSPKTIHDFYGFPKELYALNYPAEGDPGLAERACSMLVEAGIAAGTNITRGLDHGAWSPLLLMYPLADIPVIQISVQPQHDARWHYNIGMALAPLREENILIIGSGNLTHNLHQAFHGNHTATPSWVTEFAEWVANAIEEGNLDILMNWKKAAPHALQNHLTPEHFLPFFVAIGASGNEFSAKRLYKEVEMGVLAMDAYSFGD